MSQADGSQDCLLSSELWTGTNKTPLNEDLLEGSYRRRGDPDSREPVPEDDITADMFPILQLDTFEEREARVQKFHVDIKTMPF
jgi:hypothetical protein